ncbi:MAG: hypothetical protein GW949_10860 [Spirochaetales bacterium]|nr:hypothetical protein [Spirochaetales bacterium]
MTQNPKGFIHETAPQHLSVTSQQKVALIRRGNELFNQGKVEESRKIFVTLRYTDGILRLGNYYYEKKKFVEALKMFAAAPEGGQIQALAPSIAKVIRLWLETSKDEKG